MKERILLILKNKWFIRIVIVIVLILVFIFVSKLLTGLGLLSLSFFKSIKEIFNVKKLFDKRNEELTTKENEVNTDKTNLNDNYNTTINNHNDYVNGGVYEEISNMSITDKINYIKQLRNRKQSKK